MNDPTVVNITTTDSAATQTLVACPYCSNNSIVYHYGLCPRVKRIEHYPNGTQKSIEFHQTYASWANTGWGSSGISGFSG